MLARPSGPRQKGDRMAGFLFSVAQQCGAELGSGPHDPLRLEDEHKHAGGDGDREQVERDCLERDDD